MNFEALWRRRLRSILGQITEGETDYEEVANLAEHIGADYHGRFLIELLQNAEDQTTKAGITDGLAIVVRTNALVAVLNQGSPFDDKGMRSITSAGISPKKAEESIGNKGVGFKAVFQVSAAPEIFSAEDDAKLMAAERKAFRMEHAPFEGGPFRKRMKTMASEMLSQDPNLQARLKSRIGPGESWPKVLEHLKLAAPFKFPQPLGNGHFEMRCKMLSIPNRLFDRMSTLVILPLIEGNETFHVVEQALDALVDEDVPGSTLLFLRGISRLRIYDHVRERAWVLSRRQKGESCRLAKGATITPLCTTSARIGTEGYFRANAEWWQIRRRFGRDGDDAESRQEESARIETAVTRLPGKRWREVRTAYAAVTLPRVPANQPEPKRFPVAGRMCIGLPSRMATGTPVWLDGPFHGNVARTEIDLEEESQPYNRLIFEECVALLWQAIDHVKAMSGIGGRRGILFWFDSDDSKRGVLTNHFAKEHTLVSADIVFSHSGDEFLAAETLRIPEAINGDLFESLFGCVSDMDRFGFHLPDSWLLREGREILDSLADQPCHIAPVSMYVDRSENGESLIERVACIRCKAGPEWWELFLKWITERLPVEDVHDQVILPVVGGDLARSGDRVFFQPHGLPIAAGARGESEEDEETIDDLDETFTTSLRFLDEARVRVRTADRPRDLTELARKLSPDRTDGLVRRPRRLELINHMLAPNLGERSGQDPRDARCAVLLACIGKWLARMGERDRARVRFDQLLVPTSNDNSVWKWRPAEEVYMGQHCCPNKAMERPRNTLFW